MHKKNYFNNRQRKQREINTSGFSCCYACLWGKKHFWFSVLHSLAWVCQLWRPAKLLSPQFVFLSIGVDISVHVRRRKFWCPGLQHCHVVSHNQDTQPLPEVAWDLQVIYFLRNGLRDIKSNCMPKIRVIGWF